MRSGSARQDNGQKTVLITSAGGLVGTYLIKHLSRTDKYKLIGSDVSDMVSQKDKLSAFYLTSAANMPGYIDEMRRIVAAKNVEVIIPVSSHDMDVYSQEGAMEKLYPAKLLVMDHETHSKLHDKVECGQFLSSLGIRAPKRMDEGCVLEFPCVLKEDKSTGSKGTIVLEEERDYLYWKQKRKNYTIYEYLPGREYTVDCLFDREGNCIGYNPRERVKLNGGGAVISCCIMEKRLEAIIKKLESCKRIKGPVNFQYKLVDGEIVVFDFNTRLASGGLPLSVQAGFHIPEILIDLVLENEVAVWRPDEKNIGLTMLRYYDEAYIRK